MPCCRGSLREKNMRWCTWRWQSSKRAIFCTSMLSQFARTQKALAAAFTFVSPARLFQLNWIELSLLLTILSSWYFFFQLALCFSSINVHRFLIPLIWKHVERNAVFLMHRVGEKVFPLPCSLDDILIWEILLLSNSFTFILESCSK